MAHFVLVYVEFKPVKQEVSRKVTLPWQSKWVISEYTHLHSEFFVEFREPAVLLQKIGRLRLL